ncbi:TPR-like protein [Hygrophoropsis aurantiaca]|uniref:TPR-like protein n=1 Tax=Hygrophoropsis aurantiaca TaxID=72124 RepID=A0ACB8A7D1_9AGAM|nr:TPR-like protein [Hygrophoropsis aurantiaca]
MSVSSQQPANTSDANVVKMLEERAAQRATKAEERRAKSEALKEEGNNLYKDEDFIGAARCYSQAVEVHGAATKSVLNSNLAATYLKLGMNREAHITATDALLADPKSVKARFRRGMARQELGLFSAAAVDFRAVLKMDPDNKEAKSRLGFVEESLSCGDGEDAVDSDDEFPALDDPVMVPDSASESSDCEHEGNRIPCRFYNHGGCMKGRSCPYSHAPDQMSLRDNLGKNVCIYYLMGICKFGDVKCVYSHTESYLEPKDGWWTTKEGRETAMEVFALQKTQEKMSEAFMTAYIWNMHSDILSARNRHKGNGKQSGKSKSKSKSRSKTKPKKGNKKKSPSNHTYYNNHVKRSSEDYMYGFSESDVEELLSQGVKPWDEDAWDVLAALSSF